MRTPSSVSDPELRSGGYDEGNVAVFLAYLVTAAGVAPQTADSYLSHVVKRAVAMRYVKSPEDVRTPHNRGVLRVLKRNTTIGTLPASISEFPSRSHWYLLQSTQSTASSENRLTDWP